VREIFDDCVDIGSPKRPSLNLCAYGV